MVESAKILMESSTSLFCERQLGVNSHFKEKKSDPQSNFSFPDNLESNFSLQTDIFNSIWVDPLVSTAFFTGNPRVKTHF
jgi:hypothetical protein